MRPRSSVYGICASIPELSAAVTLDLDNLVHSLDETSYRRASPQDIESYNELSMIVIAVLHSGTPKLLNPTA